jgi:hypothetical protein
MSQCLWINNSKKTLREENKKILRNQLKKRVIMVHVSPRNSVGYGYGRHG